ncbi:unnamed protein product, partial [Rotaria sp. Silwood1]
MGASKHPSWPR